MARLPVTEQMQMSHHRHHLQPRNGNITPRSAMRGDRPIASGSGDSCGDSTSGHEEDAGQKMIDIGPTPPPPKETVELVAHGFDLVDGPQVMNESERE